jgi:hypothetical protein
VITRRSLRRMIVAARHDEQCCIALAVETMASAPYGDRAAARPPTGELCGHLTRAANARQRVDDYLDELAAKLRPTWSTS